MSKNFSLITLLVIVVFISGFPSTAQTSIRKINDSWELFVQDQPFEIKGVTFGYESDPAHFQDYFDDLKSLGVNTIRIWATGENTPALLDAAKANNIMVMVGIWMRHGRAGMEADDTFNYLEDEAGMEVMYQNAIATVEKFKNHPALLTWAIGNEVYLNIETDPEKEAYSILLERICAQIKKLDSNHPITSVDAWTFGMDWWSTLVPSVDIYGLNCYGPGADILPDELEKRNIDKPYIITEFGVTGEWDSIKDQNGITIEPSDEQKYEAITKGYNQWIEPKSKCLGVYFFHYASGDQFIAPWLFTHVDGSYRPQYWAIREAYTEKPPLNHPPSIDTFVLPETETASGTWIPVTLKVSDKENESLTFSFSYNQRTGSRKRRDQINPLPHRGNLSDGFEIQLPQENGPIKVYANALDTYSNVGIASTSIVVRDEKAKARKFLVAKTTLPFYVYNDESSPYTPSGHMGNIEAINVDMNNKDTPFSGSSSLMVSYDATDNWYGVGFVDPPNDWGDQLGGFDLSGAKKFKFWAKSDIGNVKAKIGFGLIESDKPFPDSAKKSIEVVLGTKWKQYSINLKKLDLSCIRSGLVIFSSSNGFRHKIYLDEVVFE